MVTKQQRFKSKGHNVYTELINKIALSSNDDKRMQSIDLIETYVCGMSKDLKQKIEKIKRDNIIGQYYNVQLWLYYKRRHKRT